MCERFRSESRVVHATLECKFWLRQAPAVDEVRPARCVQCGAAAREPGRALGVVGHGLRERQQRGPEAADAAPTIMVVLVRRYRCQHCEAVMTVVPRDVAPRRHYSRPAIALALARLSLIGDSAAAVRRAVSPWAIAATSGWPTLRRWVAAVRAGALFRAVSTTPAAATIVVAAQVAQGALGHSPPSLRSAPVLERVFTGAVAMA